MMIGIKSKMQIAGGEVDTFKKGGKIMGWNVNMNTEITINKNNIENVRDFIESGLFIDCMNINGLSFSEKSFVLQTLYDRCNEVENILSSGDEE